MNQELLSVAQIAELMDVNKETVRRWIRYGKLKASFNSRKEGFAIAADDLSEFLDHQTRPVNFKITKFAVNGTGVTETPLKIIFCKDCKYMDTGVDEEGYTFYKCLNGRSYGGTNPNNYCSWGEAKEKVEKVSKKDVLDTIDDFLLHAKSEETDESLRKLRRIVNDVL